MSNNKAKKDIPTGFLWGDLIIILLILAGSVFTFPLLHTLTAESVVVYRDNKVIAEYPLNERRTFTVDGAKGPLEIKINENSVRVTHADCPHQLCVKSGVLRRAPGQIVCAPNHILITLKASSEKEKIDAVVR